MAPHKFRIGQTVVVAPRLHETRVDGDFEITRLLPEEAGWCQYRIKSRTDGHERVVRESDIARK
jgi:hypothetical protein